MPQRKLVVEGISYTFTIGKTFTEVRDVEAKTKKHYENAHIGNPIVNGGVSVTPKCIANAILGKDRPAHHCARHSWTGVEMTANPFAVEVYGKKTLMPACPQCVENLQNDI